MGKTPPAVTPSEAVELKVTALGRLAIRLRDGSVCELTGRARDLFTMLLSAPYGSIGREEIAESLWPERDSLAADQNVRATIAALRRRLGGADYVRISGPSVVLNLPPGCRDDQVFEGVAREALASDRPDAMVRALDLYGGIYLPHDLYGDWTSYRRKILGDLRRALVIRGGMPEGVDAFTRAEWLRDLLSDDPADEAAGGQLIGLLSAAGQRADALRVAASVRSALRTELDVDPSAEFNAVAASLSHS